MDIPKEESIVATGINSIPLPTIPESKTEASLLGTFKLISKAWGLYRQKVKTVIGIMIMPAVFSLILQFWNIFAKTFSFSSIVGHSLSMNNTTIILIVVFIIFLISIIFQLLSPIALIYSFKDNQEEVGVFESYKKAASILFPYIWVTFLMTATAAAGFLFFILPGIFLVISLAFSVMVLVVENERGSKAIFKSMEYVKGKWWAVFWRFLSGGFIFCFLFFILVIAGALFKNLYFSVITVGIISNLFLIPFATLYSFLLYENLKTINGQLVGDVSFGKKFLFSIIFIIGIIALSLITFFAFQMGSFRNTNIKPMYGFNSYEDYSSNRAFIQSKIDDSFVSEVLNSSASSTAEISNDFTSIGFDYLRQDDPDTAIKRFNQAWLIDHNNHNAYFGFAIYTATTTGNLASLKYFDLTLEKFDNKYAMSVYDKDILTCEVMAHYADAYYIDSNKTKDEYLKRASELLKTVNRNNLPPRCLVLINDLTVGKYTDPDKDNDGLEDKIIESQVYKTDPEKSDTKGSGIPDGEYIYNIYRNALSINSEDIITEYQNNFKLALNNKDNKIDQNTFTIDSLEEMFNLRSAQTYNFYIFVSDDVRKIVKTALTFRLNGEYKKSLDLLSSEILKNPNSPVLKYHLGLTYHGMKEYDKAISVYEGLIGTPYIEGPLLYSDLAAANYALKKESKTIEYLELSVQKFPEDLPQYLKLANYYQETNQLDKAEGIINQGLKVESRYAPFYNQLAIIYKSRGNIDKEFGFYKKATEVDFRSASAHFNLSILFDEYKNDLNTALVEIRIAMSLDPDNIKYMSRASLIYSELGQKVKSQELERKLLKIGGIDVGTLNELGLKYMEEDYKKSELYFRRAIELDPKFPNAYNNLGIVLSSTNRGDEAIKSFKKAIELDPNYANAYNNLGWLYANNGEFDNAIKMLEKAISVNPNLPRPYGNLGNIYLTLGDKVKAKSYYEKSLSLGSVDPNVVEGLKIINK